MRGLVHTPEFKLTLLPRVSAQLLGVSGQDKHEHNTRNISEINGITGKIHLGGFTQIRSALCVGQVVSIFNFCLPLK